MKCSAILNAKFIREKKLRQDKHDFSLEAVSWFEKQIFKCYETYNKINCLYLELLGSDMHLYIGSLGPAVICIVRQFLHKVTICI